VAITVSTDLVWPHATRMVAPRDTVPLRYLWALHVDRGDRFDQVWAAAHTVQGCQPVCMYIPLQVGFLSTGTLKAMPCPLR
jgi:hypothetical protein